jgi:hypothetical protein
MNQDFRQSELKALQLEKAHAAVEQKLHEAERLLHTLRQHNIDLEAQLTGQLAVRKEHLPCTPAQQTRRWALRHDRSACV